MSDPGTTISNSGVEPPSKVAARDQIAPDPTAVLPLPGGNSNEPRRKGVLSRIRPAPASLVPAEIEDLIRKVRSHDAKADTKGIVRAFEMARALHQGQFRKSGDEFISHPVGVATILAEQGMDSTTIIAALLHDAVEDTDLSLRQLEANFGEEVATIIDGLTKIEKIGLKSKEQERAENLRKMILAMAKDLRVLIIKLADRLHNMRTVNALPPEKQVLVATDTLEIYAPLAHRLGMQQIKAALEDLAFETLYPKRYNELEQMVTARQPEREEYLSSITEEVESRLRDAKIKADVKGRRKHYYSIYEKMVGKGVKFDDIYDLVGIRIIIESSRDEDCWAVLGIIHSLWKPIPGRVKDYIAIPKFNLYRSLHTTVVGPEGKPLEIQIRTREMHRTAEWGIASHWRYKEDPRGQVSEEQSSWMRRMVDLQETQDDQEFLDILKLDLFSDEVFVFTPKGRVAELPKGSTPIDFAYSIHTEVGHACVGARVDGKLVPLAYQLSSGETVEVITSKAGGGPSRDWLDVVVTPRARTKIKQWFAVQRREEAVTEGRDALVKAFRRAKLPLQQITSDGLLAQVSADLKFSSVESLYIALGEGRLSPQTVVQKLFIEPLVTPDDDDIPLTRRPARTAKSSQGVVVQGAGDVWVKLSRCCMPVPGDPIIGFITRGRGVSIHRTDCTNALTLEEEGSERLLEVSWDPQAVGTYPVSVEVEALDRPKLLRDVTTAISDLGINMTSATSHVGKGIAQLQFTFEISTEAQLATVISIVKKVESVYDVYRVTPRPRPTRKATQAIRPS